ncbi:hypothetical protein ACTJNA_02000 [Klebsiella pneumoniae]
MLPRRSSAPNRRAAVPRREVVENIRHQLGLDLPFYQQYWRYLAGAAARRSGTLVCSAQRSE